MSCEDIAQSIYFYDLSTGEYERPNDFPHTEEVWKSDGYSLVSPNGEKLTWGATECFNPDIIWKLGREMVYGCESTQRYRYLSGIDFKDKEIYPDLEPPVVWLPRNKALFMDRQEDDGQKRTVKVSIANIDGSNSQTLRTYTYSAVPEREGLSPNGKYFVFPAQDQNSNNTLSGYIAILDLRTSEYQEIPIYMFGDISWKPDSTQFIYSGQILDESKEYYWSGLFLFDMETKESTLLGERWKGAWSPNGEWLAVYDETEGINKIYLTRPDGTIVQNVDIPEQYTQKRIHKILWSPDSSGLYIKARLQWVPQKQALIYYDIESGTTKEIFNFEDWEQYAWEKMKLSPDGEWLILETNYLAKWWGIVSDFYICNQEECIPLEPPDYFKCNRADWVGPYSTDP